MLHIDRHAVVADWGQRTNERPLRLAPAFLHVHRDTDRAGLVGHGAGQSRSTGGRPWALVSAHRVARTRAPTTPAP
jgi:hypothetical protein